MASIRLGIPIILCLTLALAKPTLPGPPETAGAPEQPHTRDKRACAPKARPLERIRVDAARRQFVLRESKRPFHPWGHNYPAGDGPLLDDMWTHDWPRIAADFREMKELGANVVRIHLQFGRFMEAPDRPNRKALDRLADLVRLAERTGLYLDITGLGCYRKADVPAWYDALDETSRWEAQARFWEAVANKCAGRPAVFCYDLLNEPLAPAGSRKRGQWYSGVTLGGYDFLQYVALEQGTRSREEIARAWIRRMTRAIRKHDRKTLITIGLLPPTRQLGHFSGFHPAQVGPEIDFVSVHLYPETGKVEEALAMLRDFQVGKPLVIEETFPLSCPVSDLEQFLLRSREAATGWLGHYEGESLETLTRLRRAQKLTPVQALWLGWLELFQRLDPTLISPAPR